MVQFQILHPSNRAVLFADNGPRNPTRRDGVSEINFRAERVTIKVFTVYCKLLSIVLGRAEPVGIYRYEKTAARFIIIIRPWAAINVNIILPVARSRGIRNYAPSIVGIKRSTTGGCDGRKR